MGQYPPPVDTRADEEGHWHLVRPDFRRLLESNPRVGPRLRELTLRLLSEAPEARGTAAQAATELEAIAEKSPVRATRRFASALPLSYMPVQKKRTP